MRLLNPEILFSPRNIMVVLIIIALWYFGVFAAVKTAASRAMPEKDAN